MLFAIPEPLGEFGSHAAGWPSRHLDAMLVFAAVSFGLGSSAAASLGAYTVSTAVAAGMNEGPAGILVAMGSIVGI